MPCAATQRRSMSRRQEVHSFCAANLRCRDTWAYEEFEIVIDCVFMADIFIKIRTSYRDHGYDVVEPKLVAKRYLRSGFFIVDLVSSVPYDRLIAALANNDSATNFVRILTLLRLLRIARLERKFDKLTGANYIRIVQMVLGFVLLAHWVGLLWFVVAVEGALKPYTEEHTVPSRIYPGTHESPHGSPTTLVPG